MALKINGRSVELERKRIKTLRLRIKPDGSLHVSAPLFVGNSAVVSFVEKNEQWICSQLEKLGSRPADAVRLYESGETILLWGRSYVLRPQSSGRPGQAELTDGAVVLHAKADSSPEKRAEYILEWRRSLLKEAVAEYLPKWERITGLHSGSWQSKAMKTRWGSCNTRTRKIWLNVALTQAPPVCLEYVILHELIHLRVSNHGADFKALMDAYMPDWRQRRKLLNAVSTELGPSQT